MKSSIIVMEKFKKLFSVTLRLSFIITLVVALALPLGLSAYAESTSNTIEIDGVLYDQIQITADEMLAIVNNGDLSSNWVFSTTSYGGYTFGDLYNMQNQTKGQFHVSANFPYSLPSKKVFALNSYNQVFIGLPYVFNSNRDATYDMSTLYQIWFPFDAYLYNTNILIQYAGCTTSSTLTIDTSYDGSNTSSSSFNLTSSSVDWNSVSVYQAFYNKFNWSVGGKDLTSLRTAYFTEDWTSPNRLIKFSSLGFQVSMNPSAHVGSFAPVGFNIQFPLDVLVEHDEATVIEEYLGLITGRPNAAQRQRIRELEDQFQSKRDQMDSIVDELHVDMPDLEDSRLDIGSMPQQALDGIVEVVPYLSNVFNFNFIVILVSSTLIFTAIKLLLYGSGPS